jgi:glycosyltransferase involved in cell wall biosynthesis
MDSSAVPGDASAEPADRLANAIFVTWEYHRRTRNLADGLGLQLHEILGRGPRLVRYVGQIARTLAVLQAEPVRAVFVQNPSLVLTATVLCWRLVTAGHYQVVMDAHNEAIEPYVNDSTVVRAVSRWAIRKSDFTIVTNPFLAARVTALGGRPVILPDPMPNVAPTDPPDLRDGDTVRVLVVATYAKDEPIDAILQAAADAGPTYEFRFTGNFRKLQPDVIAAAPRNVTFLGFLRDDEYWRQMRDAHVVLDLTLMDNCLVCGAYEAVAVGRPAILSETRALMEHFKDAALYCAPRPADIVAALTRLPTNYLRRAAAVGALRGTLAAEWASLARAIVAKVNGAEAGR